MKYSTYFHYREKKISKEEMFTKMAKFIACNFCTGHLFMASLAALHNFGICAFPILDSVQLNIHCLFAIQSATGAQKKNLVLQCHELKL